AAGPGRRTGVLGAVVAAQPVIVDGARSSRVQSTGHGSVLRIHPKATPTESALAVRPGCPSPVRQALAVSQRACDLRFVVATVAIALSWQLLDRASE
ncbi:MAG: hypothetical protein LC777_05110, partial [Actinobacteria bacterium]|nr:hypothetical protein [Actinomycetota bacterium]